MYKDYFQNGTMKKLVVIILFLSLAVMPKVKAMPEITALKMDDKINLDGKLDDNAWRRAQWTKIDAEGEPRKCPASTEAAIAYDKDNIYFAFICRYPPGTEISSTQRDRDGSVWNDDSVELFLDPGLTRGQFYHFIVNASGSIYDGYGDQGGKREEGNWNFNVTVVVGREQEAWTLEMAIPFSSLNVPSFQKSDWGVNFCRSYVPKCGDHKLFNWSGFSGMFAQPDKFGIIRGIDLAGRTGAVIDFFDAEIKFGAARLPVVISGLSDAALVQTEITILDNNGKKIGEYQKAFTVPVCGGEVELPYSNEIADGRAKVTVQVKDTASGRLLAEMKRSMKFDNLLELSINNTIFFLSEKPAVNIGVSMKIQDDALRRMSLNCTIKNKIGEMRILEPMGFAERISILYPKIGGLDEGEYELKCELREDKKVLKELTSTLIAVNGPFDHDKTPL